MEQFKVVMHTMPMEEESGKEPRQSFLHPQRKTLPKNEFQQNILKTHDKILQAERKHLLKVSEYEQTPPEFTVDSKTKLQLQTLPITTVEMIAISESSSHHLVRDVLKRYPREFSYKEFKAIAYYEQFGNAREYSIADIDMNVHDDEAIYTWTSWSRKYEHEEIVQYANDCATRFEGYYITLPVDL